MRAQVGTQRWSCGSRSRAGVAWPGLALNLHSPGRFSHPGAASTSRTPGVSPVAAPTCLPPGHPTSKKETRAGGERSSTLSSLSWKCNTLICSCQTTEPGCPQRAFLHSDANVGSTRSRLTPWGPLPCAGIIETHGALLKNHPIWLPSPITAEYRGSLPCITGPSP